MDNNKRYPSNPNHPRNFRRDGAFSARGERSAVRKHGYRGALDARD